MKTDTEWFKDKLQAKGLTSRTTASLMGMTPTAFSRLINGLRHWQSQDAADMARVLGLPTEDVMHHAGVLLPTDVARRVPLVGVAGGDGRVGPRPATGSRVVERPSGAPEDAAAVRVQAQGSPMDGWICYFVPAKKIDPDAVGRLALVTAGTGEKWLRVLTRGYERGKWNLRPLVGANDDVAGVAVISATPVLLIKT